MNKWKHCTSYKNLPGGCLLAFLITIKNRLNRPEKPHHSMFCLMFSIHLPNTTSSIPASSQCTLLPSQPGFFCFLFGHYGYLGKLAGPHNLIKIEKYKILFHEINSPMRQTEKSQWKTENDQRLQNKSRRNKKQGNSENQQFYYCNMSITVMNLWDYEPRNIFCNDYIKKKGFSLIWDQLLGSVITLV